MSEIAAIENWTTDFLNEQIVKSGSIIGAEAVRRIAFLEAEVERMKREVTTARQFIDDAETSEKRLEAEVERLRIERNAWKRECYRRIRVCYGKPGTASIQDCIEGSESIVAEEISSG